LHKYAQNYNTMRSFSRLTPIYIWLLTGWAFSANAQQLPQYSLWLLNPYAYNPAAAGLENTLVLNGVYRQQWIDLNGAPVSQHVNAHLPIYMLRSGAGLKVDNDVIGAHQTTQVMASYNYQLEIGRSGLISVGAGIGYQQYTLDGAKLRAPDGSYVDPALNHNDPFLPVGKLSIGTPIAEFGIVLQTSQLTAGLSSQPVFAPVIREKAPGQFRLKPERHYVLTASYKIKGGENVTIRPGILLKTDLAATQAEVSALAFWKDNIFVGGSYRGFTIASRDAAVISGGARLNEKITVGYAFDLPLSALKSANRGSHELMLRYQLNRPLGAGKLPPVIYNPRFF
jgi:type IX secretion system PorP/SprF family membrane protein